MSDTDDSFNFLISMCYTQLFNLLCEKADDVYGGRLPVHVRCLIDECANNQMRDVFIEEVPIPDLESYVRKRHGKDRDFTFEREDLADGTVIYHVNTSGLLQRYTFTEI